jgi:hypothetical protein
MGNRTAAPLLASFAASTLLCWGGVQFNFLFWIMLDLVVVAFIVHYRMTWADLVILALFIPAWLAYLAPEPWRFYGTFAAVVLQFAFTLPVARLWVALRRPRGSSDGKDFDMKMVAI